ncbi:imidazole glycerol phosphate synthase subunit HisF [Candidatus Woesearchaeota archaeon]|nr:imidazole glycerol phosphate synthase subunit HisF [Candidatus Woesearchaeota archaeon]
MLKKRIIANLVVRDGIVVQSIGFERYLPVGKPEVAVEFLNAWGIDEIIIADINAGIERRIPDLQMISSISKKCFVPVTVAGGIKSIEMMRELIRCGADKIAINTAAVEHPSLISEGAEVFGSQCIVVSIDVRKNSEGKYEVFSRGGRRPTGLNPVEFAQTCEQLGAGEIIINSIDRDGSRKGYDLSLVASVSDAVSIPVIALGGAGHPRHFVDALTTGKATAAAAGNFFHFCEQSVVLTKEFLTRNQVNVRHDTYAQYADFLFDGGGRIQRRSDDELQGLRFKFLPKESI